MKRWINKNYKYIIYSLIIALIFIFPYLIKDFLPIEHDTFFHLSRIEGLAHSFQDGQFFPKIYPYKNMNFGYASPLFYSDFFLIIPAILYILGISLSMCYILVIFACSFLSCYFMMKLCEKITSLKFAPYIAGVLYLFSNYRITDVYVRGALGEVMGFVFLPLVLLGIYYVLYDDESKWYMLIFGFGGLVLSHNITFVLACILFLAFIGFNFAKLLKSKSRMMSILKAILLTFLLTAFFTLPMLEQTTSQEFFLHYYGSSMNLAEYDVLLWQYFANVTTFGFGSNNSSKEMVMLVNVGLFTMCAPLLILFNRKKERNIQTTFITTCLFIGYFFMLLPLSIFPWANLSFLRIIQFPWRFMMLALVCLVIPASVAIASVIKSKKIIIVLISILLFEGICHLTPVLNRTFGITSKTTYSEMIDGSLIDPFYSAFYVRVELAGADYLPINSPDYRDQSPCITDTGLTPITCNFTKENTNLYFSIANKNSDYILPLTYYKGYQVYEVNQNNEPIKKVNTCKAGNTFVGFTSSDASNYVCKYDGTLIQTISLYISILTLAALLIYTGYRYYLK